MEGLLYFIDFEVFKEDWLCVIVEPFLNQETVIVNDRDALIKFYNNTKDKIYVGHNITGYDQFIFKGIILGLDPKRINDKIILEGKKGYQVSALFNNINLIFYDTLRNNGLKTLEAFMGHNIKESSVPFNIDRKLTDAEIQETVEYCKNDVYETINVFTKEYEEFLSKKSLVETFNLPLSYIGKSKPQISAKILECFRRNFNDEFDIYTVDTLRLEKYKEAQEWFLNPEHHNYNEGFKLNVAGVEHIFAWGGLHGARNKYHGKGNLWHIDVEGYYPLLMIQYNILSRSVSKPEKYKTIRETRIKYKHEGSPLQLPYKIVLNATYGICKDKYSDAYDPRNANLVCVNGQLLLLDLIEKLEQFVPGFELIQSNTDGLIIKLAKPQDEFKMRCVCRSWETRTGMNLAYDKIDEIWQKDVNNYIFRFKGGKKDGKLERKGAYVKELSELDNDLPIVNEAVVKALTESISVEETINNCNELIKFQKIVKTSSKYKYGWHNGHILTEKTNRVFASKNANDTYIGKQKDDGKTIEKFGNTPAHVFIDNGNILGKKIPENLDKNYYIELAKERLSSFIE